ncbi:unnamed protein product, partial [Prorocentrum cordatum]
VCQKSLEVSPYAEPKCTHVFSCDIKESARRFIMTFRRPQYLFGDVAGMSAPRAFDRISSSTVGVPGSLDVLIAGFVCGDVSSLNVHQGANKDCIAKGTKRTGSTFKGVLDYVASRFPRVMLLENVEAMNCKPDDGAGPSNGEAVCAALRRIGYAVRMVTLQPSDHGVPQRRRRCWFICCLVKNGDVSDSGDSQELEKFLDSTVRVVKDLMIPHSSLDMVLMPAKSPELRAWQDQRTSIPDEPQEPATKAMKWKELHKATFRAKGLRWPPEMENIYDSRDLELIQQLPLRSREVIAFHDLTNPMSGPMSRLQPGDEIIIDVGQSINRTTAALNLAPCVCPKSLLWMRRRRRLVEPYEELALQGVPIYDKADLSAFSHREVRDLAGMAFCGHNVLALLFAVFSTYHFPDILAGPSLPASTPGTDSPFWP